MNNRVEELLSGTPELNRPELLVSVSELKLQIQEGKNYKGSLQLGTADGSKIKGLVTADSHRILLADNSIAGDSCTVLFGVDTKGLKEGDRIAGALCISCNLTERRIPVEAEIVSETVKASRGEVKTLEDFSRLCRKSFREGFRLFTGPSFPGLLRGKNRSLLPLYKGLSHNPVTYQHLEEFLIASGRKEPVLFTLDRQEKAPFRLDASQKDTLYIYKNSWGYLRIEVELTGSFLQVEKKVITSEDFIGSAYGLEYIVRADRLHQGRNYGKIRLKSVNQTEEYTIEASAGPLKPVEGLEEKRFAAALTRDMLDLQLRNIDYRTWQEKGQKTVSDLKEWDPENSAAVLYEAYLAYAADDLQRMHTLLELFRRGSRTLKTEEERTWYLYLLKLAGIQNGETEGFLSSLRLNLEQAPDQYLYLHLLLQEDPSYEHMSARILFELEQCWEKGGNSPFLYLKAWKMLDEQEALLRRITPFYLQVLRFAAVRNLLSESLYRRTAFLSGSLREFSEPVYRLLADGYKKYKSRDILEAVCKLVMKGQAFKKEYFAWYSLAVEQGLRITRLYEYYMETLPRERMEQIPRQIRMYFAYNSSSLSERKRALLYSNVILNRAVEPACFKSYHAVIREFTLKSLEKGRMTEEYAALYQAVLEKPENKSTAEKLAKVLFRHKVQVKNPSIRYVVVCHEALKEERSYPCREGIAYVDLYSEDACLLFEDEKRRRFASACEYACTPVMEAKDTARFCMDLGVEDTGLELYCCREKAWKMDVTGRTLDYYRKAEANGDFSDAYRRSIRQKLLDYYMKNRDNERLLVSVLTGSMTEYAAVDNVSTAVLLIESGLYERAFRVVSEFGYEKIPDALLLRLASRMILRMEFREDEDLLALSEYVFRLGKYDEIMLTYLLEYSMGSMEYLCELWQRVKGFHLEPLKLEKRILVLAVVTGKMPVHAGGILESYVLNQGQETVISSFLTWASQEMLYRDEQLPEQVFLYIEKLSGRGWNLNLLCPLALLKHYAQKKTLNPRQKEEAEKILELCGKEGLAFGFFKDLPEELTRSHALEDRLFVEEKFLPGTAVTIHYYLGHGAEAEPEWKSEPLKEMIPGIYVKEFLLFYGEVLTWYLTFRMGEEEKTLEQHQLTLTSLDTEGSSRYKILNRILSAKAMGNRERMEKAAEEYLRKDALAKHFCGILQQ